MGLSAFGLEALALPCAAATFGLALPWGEATPLLALANLAGVLSLVPGGVGAAEGSMLLLLAAKGAPRPLATATTLLYRAATLWLGIVVGLAATARLERVRRSGQAAKA